MSLLWQWHCWIFFSPGKQQKVSVARSVSLFPTPSQNRSLKQEVTKGKGNTSLFYGTLPVVYSHCWKATKQTRWTINFWLHLKWTTLKKATPPKKTTTGISLNVECITHLKSTFSELAHMLRIPSHHGRLFLNLRIKKKWNKKKKNIYTHNINIIFKKITTKRRTKRHLVIQELSRSE